MDHRSLRSLAAFVAMAAPWPVHAQMHAQTADPAMPGDHMHMDKTPAVPSTTLAVSLPNHPALMLSVADLQALPQVTISVLNAHSKQQETYTGPLVAEVLAKAGLTLTEDTQHQVLDSYISARGTDGYFVIFSGAELQPALHKAQPIIAIARGGQPLAGTGAFQLVDPVDVKPARWVRNLGSIAMVPVSAPQP